MWACGSTYFFIKILALKIDIVESNVRFSFINLGKIKLLQRDWHLQIMGMIGDREL